MKRPLLLLPLLALAAAACASIKCSSPPPGGSVGHESGGSFLPESAIKIPNRLRLDKRSVPLSMINELTFAIEKGRLPCDLVLDCRNLETGNLSVSCENGKAMFFPSNKVSVSSERGTETFSVTNPVATVSFGPEREHEKVLLIDLEGLRRQQMPDDSRTVLKCSVREDDNWYYATIPLVFSEDCPPSSASFSISSNWYDY